MKNGQIQLEQFSKSWLQIGFSLSLFIFMWWRWKVNQTSRNCTFVILGPGATLGRILLDYLLNCKPLQNLMLKTLSLSTPLFPSGHWTVLDRMSSRFLTGFPQDFVQISLRFSVKLFPLWWSSPRPSHSVPDTKGVPCQEGLLPIKPCLSSVLVRHKKL